MRLIGASILKEVGFIEEDPVEKRSKVFTSRVLFLFSPFGFCQPFCSGLETLEAEVRGCKTKYLSVQHAVSILHPQAHLCCPVVHYADNV